MKANFSPFRCCERATRRRRRLQKLNERANAEAKRAVDGRVVYEAD